MSSALLETILHPLSFTEFREKIYMKLPLAGAGTAAAFRRLISWDLLQEIFAGPHRDCWLARNGKLADDPALSTGRLTLEQAQKGFTEGQTVFVRHSERAHPRLGEIAGEFGRVFGAPIDIQLYVTPPGQEGFDWHYDVEEVFVLQSSGEKEFRLRKNRREVRGKPVVTPKNLQGLDEQSEGPEVRCLLKAGDWLYIPAGYWHKARAVTPSFHLSVGVLEKPAGEERPVLS